MKLRGQITQTGDLSREDKDSMFHLMATHFDGMRPENFSGDLIEKPWAIVLRDADTGAIQGFTTIMFLAAELDGLQIKALFSGDTIINKNYWGEMELGRMWLKFVFKAIEENKSARLYWFLISQGYRTYSYLPIYFDKFYPRYDQPFPVFEKKALDTLAKSRFQDEYNPDTGIIRFKTPKDRLKPQISEIREKRLENPNIRFFVKANPFHCQGDELACIAPLTPDNLKPIAYRVLRWDGHAKN